MSAFTVEQLIAAIRDADTLSELKRMVGPSDDDNRLAERRVNTLDAMLRQYGHNRDLWPYHARERFDRINEEQNRFEAEFC